MGRRGSIRVSGWGSPLCGWHRRGHTGTCGCGTARHTGLMGTRFLTAHTRVQRGLRAAKTMIKAWAGQERSCVPAVLLEREPAFSEEGAQDACTSSSRPWPWTGRQRPLRPPQEEGRTPLGGSRRLCWLSAVWKVKVGQDFYEKMNWETFLFHFLRLHVLSGKRKNPSLERRGYSAILTREAASGGFCMRPGVPLHPPSPSACVSQSGGSTTQGQGPGGLGSHQGGQWAAEVLGELLQRPPPSLGQDGLFPLSWAVQPNLDGVSWEEGTRGTFEFTNSIKSIYIFMAAGKFPLVHRNGEM